MTKTVIILNKPKGARLANQLWNFVSVYAYCLEKGYRCHNYSFFEDKKQENRPNSIKTYYQFFDIEDTLFIRFLLWLHVKLSQLSQKPRIYYRYVEYIKKKCVEQIIYSGDNGVFMLPPTENTDKNKSDLVQNTENSDFKKIYFDGWLFRNPVGIETYRRQIVQYFRPNKETEGHVQNLIVSLRKKYKKVIGVHIRQSDYKKLFENGKYYFNEREVRKIMDEYLLFAALKPEEVIFLLCSEESINASFFEGLNTLVAGGNEAEDLFTLASCDTIIGSRSTFGPWAALYGNVPFIMFEREMNWDYYKQKDMRRYFDNEKVGMLSFSTA